MAANEDASASPASGMDWAVGPLDESAIRYPDLGAIADRARTLPHLLRRLVDEVERESLKRGLIEPWKQNVFASVVGVWMNGAGSASRVQQRHAAKALEDRRGDIIEAADRLRLLLERNDGQLGAEIGLDLRALPVSIRFPGLLPSLKGLSDWARRDGERRSTTAKDAGGVQLFVERVDEALDFRLSHEAVADLWRLLEQEEVTASAVRMARQRSANRTNQG